MFQPAIYISVIKLQSPVSQFRDGQPSHLNDTLVPHLVEQEIPIDYFSSINRTHLPHLLNFRFIVTASVIIRVLHLCSTDASACSNSLAARHFSGRYAWGLFR